MSRYCELFQGGSNGFEIKDVEGYKRWKESIDDDFQILLHEEQTASGFYVYVGIRWEKKQDLDDLDTYVNHFHPDGDGGDSGTPVEFWSGLSLFVKEPIELLQTDEEWPHLTKAFGWKRDEGMYRLWAFEGKVIVQELGFSVLKTHEYKKEDVIDEEILEYVTTRSESLCGKCGEALNPIKFKFETRGYYDEVKDNSEFNKLCEKCYKELKKPFVEMEKLEREIRQKREELDKLKATRKNSGGGH